MKYPLVRDPIDSRDIDALCDWLKTNPRLSKGPLTLEFEAAWAEWLGTKYAVYVNSGSSANLLVLYSLIEKGVLSPGDKVVVPAVSWATDLAPVIQFGLVPVLCDCNFDNLSLDLDHFEQICKTDAPKAVMFVSVLGLVPDMRRVVDICQRYNVCLVEDTCESLGSEFQGQKLGTFGDVSTFSLYVAHHISTVEGGIVATNDRDLYNILLAVRSHGWARDMEPEYREKYRKEWDIDEFNELYTFYHSGFNLRATDFQAFLGIRQLERIDEIIDIREKNYQCYMRNVTNDTWKPNIDENSLVSNYCYPMIVSDREKLCNALASESIETRPLIAGSMALQPFHIKKYGNHHLPNAERVHKNGLYLPNYHNLKEEEIEYISTVVNRIIG